LKNLTLGLAVSNALQPQVKLFLSPDQPVRIYRPALSYLLRTSQTSHLWVSVEGEVPEQGNYLVKAGAEFDYNDLFFARAGFDGVGPTGGAGVRVAGFELDYAFNQRDLGALHRFSLTYRFGAYQDPLQAQRIDLMKWVARSYTRANDYDPAIQAWKNVLAEYPNDPEAKNAIKDLQKKRRVALDQQIREAQSAVARGDYDRALPLIAKIFSLDPGNPQAKELLKRVDKKMLVSTNYMRGVEAYGREDFETAVEYLQTVYDVDPSYRDVRHLYQDAQSHYQPLQSMPKELTDLYAKGVDYYIAGQFQKAIDAWVKVLEKDPKNYLIQRNLDEARSRLKEKPEPSSSIIKDTKTKP
jgi:tetratricopeptide (TPR) repeat protein